jgi:hypothetical protein
MEWTRKCILHTEVGRDKTTAAIFVTVSYVHEKNFQLSMRSTMQRRVLFYLEAKEEVKDDENHLCGLVCQISLPKCRAFLTSNYNNINTTHRHRDCLDSAKDAQAISYRV